MAFAWTSLAAGQLTNAKTTIYVSVGESSIQTLRLVENSGASHSASIWLKVSGGSSVLLSPPNMPMDSSNPAVASLVDVIEDDPLELAAGDEIEGQADANGVIDYTITGGTR